MAVSTIVSAQKQKYNVDRCTAANRNKPVHNVFVGADNVKWVGSGQEYYQVRACNTGSMMPLELGELSVFSFYSGNVDLRWKTDVMLSEARGATDISCAWYDAKNDWLWIGTKNSGLFQFKTKPALTFIEQMSAQNSKLKSNEITSIFQDASGKYWIGTSEGLMVGAPKRWKNELDGFHVQRVRAVGADFYVLADSEFWIVQSDRFKPVNLEEKALEGEAVDFDFDPSGSLWIVSRMLTRYDLATDEFDVFSGPEYYTSEYGKCIAADVDGAIWVGTEDKGLYRIEKAASFTATLLVEQELNCTGNGKDASLIVKLEGGKTPFTYQWSNAALAGNNPKNLSAGNYTVTVTDVSGVTKTAKVTINDALPKLTAVQKTPESGLDAKDGSAELTIEGGAKPYQIKWSSGASTATASQLKEGKYTVTVTDQKGCTASTSVSITQKVTAMNVVVQWPFQVKCKGATAEIKVTVIGGKPPYQYKWSNPTFKGELLTGVAPGAYQLTVTDALGSTFTNPINISEPEALVATLQVIGAASTGKTDGKATVEGKGGTGKYSYAWDTGETNATAFQLGAGKHNVTLTDANGCTTSISLEMRENIIPLSVIVKENEPITCFGKTGSLKVTVAGGKTPYQYKWSAATMQGETPANVPAGTYTLTVTDAVNGTATATYTLKQPDELRITVNAIAAASTEKSDGKATADSKGGAGKYIYAWDSGESSANAVKLNAGKHSVTLTDANGCMAIGTVDIRENIQAINVLITENESIKCAGKTGSLKVAVSGGKAPFQYRWSDATLQGESPVAVKAGIYQLTVTDAVGGTAQANFTFKQPDELSASATATSAASTGMSDGKAQADGKGGSGKFSFSWDNGENTANAVKLAPGKHTLTLTDANGCTAVASVDMRENILPLTVSVQEIENVKCNGGAGSLKATVSGGKAPFQYQWSANTLQGDRPTGVKAGTYQLTVTDVAGGTSSTAFTLKQPDALEAIAVAANAASTGKADGKAAVQGKGGTGKYTIAWDDNETTATAIKLTPGNHTVTLTDVNGCTAVGSVEITENILPLALRLEETGKIKCAGQGSAVKVILSGGKEPYKYQWSDAKITGAAPDAMLAGTYQLTVTDAPGSTVVASISIRQPQPIAVNATVTASASTGNADGKASITALGGGGKFLYAWDNGETTANANKLAPGKHSVTVTDANVCTASETIEITENILPLTVNLLETGSIKCAGEKSSIKATISGGKPPFQYQWSFPSSQQTDITGVAPGTYQLTVSDAKNTTATSQVIVKGPDSLLAKVLRSGGATTERSKDGWATIEVKGGTKPFSILWDNGENIAAATKLNFGSRQVTVTDAQNCSAFAAVEIGKRILPELSAASLISGQAIKVEQLRFDADSSSLNPSCYPVLNEVYNFLQENGSIVIEVGGHTNNVPSDAFADKLSTARAKAAADYLVAKGVDPKRVTYKGYGKRKPISSNSTALGRLENQRVEIKILEIKKQ
jgi:outer membrane protein OmpA-like peptidoglycan-associated protein